EQAELVITYFASGYFARFENSDSLARGRGRFFLLPQAPVRGEATALSGQGGPAITPAMPLDVVHSACPHDCPSTCALEVERLDAYRIGRVRAARDNPYTAGVVCAKAARYAERQHHPGRLAQPLRRVGAKGEGIAAFRPIAWDAALDIVAEGLTRATQRYGSESVWPYFYAGTMGCGRRDGHHRLRRAMLVSSQRSE